MRAALTIFRVLQFAIAAVMIVGDSHAQNAIQKLAAKNGESIELGSVYWVVNCRSIMIGLPEIEILEGPPEVALSLKEAQVLPRRQGCASKVAGGTLMLKADGVIEPKDAKMTYRLKYKTKDGDRQTSNTYLISLFP